MSPDISHSSQQQAIATLAVAIVRNRGSVDVASIMRDVSDAGHILFPARDSHAYREWHRKNGLLTAKDGDVLAHQAAV